MQGGFLQDDGLEVTILLPRRTRSRSSSAQVLLLFVAGFAITASGDPPKDEVDVAWAEAPGRPPREKDAYAAFNDHWGDDDDDDDLPTATV